MTAPLGPVEAGEVCVPGDLRGGVDVTPADLDLSIQDELAHRCQIAIDLQLVLPDVVQTQVVQ